MIWLTLRSLITTNAFRLAQFGAAIGAVLAVLLSARSSGRAAEKVEQYEDAIKARKRMEDVPPANEPDTLERLRKGEF
jgi:hypothetical protein